MGGSSAIDGHKISQMEGSNSDRLADKLSIRVSGSVGRAPWIEDMEMHGNSASMSATPLTNIKRGEPSI